MAHTAFHYGPNLYWKPDLNKLITIWTFSDFHFQPQLLGIYGFNTIFFIVFVMALTHGDQTNFLISHRCLDIDFLTSSTTDLLNQQLCNSPLECHFPELQRYFPFGHTHLSYQVQLVERSPTVAQAPESVPRRNTFHRERGIVHYPPHHPAYHGGFGQSLHV